MNLSKNLIVALLGLGCYAHCNNINLANNTTVLLIILALLVRWHNDENTETETRTTRSITTVSHQDTNNGNTTRTVYSTPTNQNGFPYPFYGFGNFPGTSTTFQTTVPFNSGMMTNGNWGCPYGNCSSANNIVY